MRLKILHIIFILFLSTAGIFGQSVSIDSIGFGGNRAFTREQLLDTWTFRGNFVTREDVDSSCKAILGSYRRAGYYQAECRAEFGADSSSVLVRISEGPRYLVGDILFDGNSYLGSVFLQGLMTTGGNEALDSTTITRDMEAISLAYADNGFPQAEISLKELKYENNHLQITFGIKENTRVLVSKITFKGNLATKEATLLKISGLDPGSPFSRLDLEKALKQLNSSGLFIEVNQPLLLIGSETGQQQILIRVKEDRFNRIFGAASYIQPSAGQKGWLAGSLDLFLGNIAGTARSASVRWERPQKENSRLEIDYSEPFLFGFDVSARVGLKHMVEDSAYVKTSAGLLVKMPVGEGFKAGVGAEYERIVPGAALIYQKSNKYSTTWLLEWHKPEETTFSNDVFLKVQADYGRKSYYQPSQQLTVSKITGDGVISKKIFVRQEIFLAIKGRMVITGEKPVPRYDQFAMGGTASLRGYYQEQFIANRIAWSNLEYRYKPVKNLMVFPFADLGYFFDRERSLRGYRFGYGFGFKLDTRIGWINIVYGLGRDDSFLNGKVHFGLESEF
ncbi:BamA/TamA family outer membrane protein [candidate division TA06 bacterium]|uniref:BamA/TamA family outer membrane protein n=1 Tax=candidate division TA06 bacterium TaxID=2250710 RepID=A0A933MIZ9_UNCT6|nr:BamA/TamA family outer membrane protein [candidate division TA06 bacterium]